MRTLLVALSIALATATAGTAIAVTHTDHGHYAAPTRIEEDNPLFNCHTDGNRVCGTRDSLAQAFTRDLINGEDPTKVAVEADGVCEVIYYPATNTYRCEI